MVGPRSTVVATIHAVEKCWMSQTILSQKLENLIMVRRTVGGREKGHFAKRTHFLFGKSGIARELSAAQQGLQSGHFGQGGFHLTHGVLLRLIGIMGVLFLREVLHEVHGLPHFSRLHPVRQVVGVHSRFGEAVIQGLSARRQVHVDDHILGRYNPELFAGGEDQRREGV